MLYSLSWELDMKSSRIMLLFLHTETTETKQGEPSIRIITIVYDTGFTSVLGYLQDDMLT